MSSPPRRRAGRAGFTLLEVLVAIAILGLGLTAILSAQAGLFASATYAERVSVAAGLVRCKMSEVEVKLLKDGYPIVDSDDEGPCCSDESYEGYTCKWKVETVELPAPPEGDALGDMLGGGDGTDSTSGGLGPLGALASLAQPGAKGGIGDDAKLGDVAKLLTGPGGGDDDAKGALASGAMDTRSVLAPLVMNFVYPTLKPMLEASIRRVTVTIGWKEGTRDRELAITQFVTNPQQGGFDPNAAEGAPTLDSLGLPGTNPSTSPGKSPSTKGTELGK